MVNCKKGAEGERQASFRSQQAMHNHIEWASVTCNKQTTVARIFTDISPFSSHLAVASYEGAATASIVAMTSREGTVTSRRAPAGD